VRRQEILFLVRVTPLVTIPVAFVCYPPDPAYRQWSRRRKQLKKLGLPKTQRPPKPPKNPDYPTKQQRAFGLLE
jgi:hypothetical protein